VGVKLGVLPYGMNMLRYLRTKSWEENLVAKERKKETTRWRKLQIVGLHDLYSSHTVSVIE
jgi:hypothetical protein